MSLQEALAQEQLKNKIQLLQVSFFQGPKTFQHLKMIEQNLHLPLLYINFDRLNLAKATRADILLTFSQSLSFSEV